MRCIMETLLNAVESRFPYTWKQLDIRGMSLRGATDNSVVGYFYSFYSMVCMMTTVHVYWKTLKFRVWDEFMVAKQRATLLQK